jgi:phage terminase large subunit
MNEANEFSREDYQQLILRTTGQIYMDYNPSDQFHWIYEDVLTREDCTFIKSTYMDNPFLPAETVREIERLRTQDDNYWRVYGLGERGMSQATIYTHWQYIDRLPKEADEHYYGLDFGFNNPTALVEIAERDQDIFAQELIYESGLTNSDLIKRLDDLKISKQSIIYADSAEPQRIEELKRAGYWVEPADKDVRKGIDTIKTRSFSITKSSVNLLKEVKSYKWKEKDGQMLDEPVKANDHILDALRYGVHTHSKQSSAGILFI